VTLRRLAIAAALAVAGTATLLCGPAALAAERGAVTRAALASASAAFPVATDVRVGGDDKATRFVMDFDRRIGLVKTFRYGLIMQGGSRIVLDTKGPVRVDKAFALAAADGQPARLVVDLSPTDRASFLRTISLEDRTNRSGASKHASSAAADTPGDPRPMIVIDPGHGGIDSGTKSFSGQDEKDVVLAFGLMLRGKLEKTGKYRVAMTRDDDTFVPLHERVRFARARKAALFISIHADSIPRSEGQAEGASVYTLSEHASDAEAASLAEAENRSDAIAGVDLSSEPDDVANILIDLAQRETKVFSLQFARTLVGELKPVTPLHVHPLKSAGFIVLKAPDVPSVLVELGYMTTKSDLVHLMSPEWRSRTADSLVQAVNTFFAPRLAGAAAARGAD
jgi:N-acetylmuramoyl-L-alanine amidase